MMKGWSEDIPGALSSVELSTKESICSGPSDEKCKDANRDIGIPTSVAIARLNIPTVRGGAILLARILPTEGSLGIAFTGRIARPPSKTWKWTAGPFISLFGKWIEVLMIRSYSTVKMPWKSMWLGPWQPLGTLTTVYILDTLLTLAGNLS